MIMASVVKGSVIAYRWLRSKYIGYLYFLSRISTTVLGLVSVALGEVIVILLTLQGKPDDITPRTVSVFWGRASKSKGHVLNKSSSSTTILVKSWNMRTAHHKLCTLITLIHITLIHHFYTALPFEVLNHSQRNHYFSP
jgi:hypothetical protein